MKIKFEYENEARVEQEKQSGEMRLLKVGAIILSALAIAVVILYKIQDIVDLLNQLLK